MHAWVMSVNNFYVTLHTQKKQGTNNLIIGKENENFKVWRYFCGSAQRMKDVAKLICTGDRNIVVLSAMSGTTNSLVEISDYLYKKKSGWCK